MHRMAVIWNSVLASLSETHNHPLIRARQSLLLVMVIQKKCYSFHLVTVATFLLDDQPVLMFIQIQTPTPMDFYIRIQIIQTCRR